MQIAAHDLGVPLSSVFIAETATDKVSVDVTQEIVWRPGCINLTSARFKMRWQT
jgi:hypothetical protein